MLALHPGLDFAEVPERNTPAEDKNTYQLEPSQTIQASVAVGFPKIGVLLGRPLLMPSLPESSSARRVGSARGGLRLSSR
mmetsp:Transcript_50890/g.128361  ORF Transcript_50890/g.128361 Transcript_50890/m.128361 type:complete len:80 (+) Transcript_50890:583-822(+)